MFRAQHDDSDALVLLPEWREPVSAGRILRAVVGSIIFHVIFVVTVVNLPTASFEYRGPDITVDLRRAIPLVAPRNFELTQKDPNREKVSTQLDASSALPPLPKARAFRPPVPVGPVAAPAPGALPEPPQIQAAVSTPEIAGVPPSIPKLVEKPKIVFESVGGGPEQINAAEHAPMQVPRTSVEDLARASGQQGGLSTGAAPSGDAGASAIPQLLSDPQGVDFKPYLLQVRALVLRRWLSVVPESARLGRQGQVVIHFVIDRRGGVPKLVIEAPSGISAFDRAAVAGIQASLPFPPLPSAYKGDEIRLQMAFSYNLGPRAR
jgi:TonB family protein